MTWQHIDKEPPPVGTRVLIGNRGKVRIACWRAQDDAYGAGWWDDERDYFLGLTYTWWQPLPACPGLSPVSTATDEVAQQMKAIMEPGGVQSIFIVNPGARHQK